MRRRQRRFGQKLALRQLRHVAHLRSELAAARKVGGVDTVNAHGPRVGHFERARKLDGGRLARARMADERGKAAGGDGERDAIEGKWSARIVGGCTAAAALSQAREESEPFTSVLLICVRKRDVAELDSCRLSCSRGYCLRLLLTFGREVRIIR